MLPNLKTRLKQHLKQQKQHLLHRAAVEGAAHSWDHPQLLVGSRKRSITRARDPGNKKPGSKAGTIKKEPSKTPSSWFPRTLGSSSSHDELPKLSIGGSPCCVDSSELSKGCQLFWFLSFAAYLSSCLHEDVVEVSLCFFNRFHSIQAAIT